MTAFTRICPICAKFVGGVNPVSHARCSKQLQQIYSDKKRKAAPANLTAKRGGSLAGLILRTAA